MGLSREDVTSLAISIASYYIARRVIRDEAWKWAVLGFCVCLQGWEFSWSCGVPLGGFGALDERPAQSYSERTSPRAGSVTRPDFLHALITSVFDGACMALIAALARSCGGSLQGIDLKTCGVLLAGGWAQNALVTRCANLNLNHLATSPLAPHPKCRADEQDDGDVCWSNQSMWVLAPLLTCALAGSQPESHPARVGASAILLFIVPLATCAQGPQAIWSAHPYELSSLVGVLCLAATADSWRWHPVCSGGRARESQSQAPAFTLKESKGDCISHEVNTT
jgi:hypothetical protein